MSIHRILEVSWTLHIRDYSQTIAEGYGNGRKTGENRAKQTLPTEHLIAAQRMHSIGCKLFQA